MLWQLLAAQGFHDEVRKAQYMQPYAITQEMDAITPPIKIIVQPKTVQEEAHPPPPVEDPGQIFEVTAYTAGYESTQKRRGEPGFGITASGAHVRQGVTIACPRSMPFGTVIKIEGIGDRVCQDRGGAITEGHLDLYMDSLQAAKKFGRQKLRIWVKG